LKNLGPRWLQRYLGPWTTDVVFGKVFEGLAREGLHTASNKSSEVGKSTSNFDHGAHFRRTSIFMYTERAPGKFSGNSHGRTQVLRILPVRIAQPQVWDFGQVRSKVKDVA
jgi:hypothetical protein